MLKRKRGFTLIEMMVVFAIIAVLIALIQPRYQRAMETSRQNLVLSNLNALAAAADRYFLDNGTNTVLTTDLVGPNLYIKSWNRFPMRSTPRRLLPAPRSRPPAAPHSASPSNATIQNHRIRTSILT